MSDLAILLLYGTGMIIVGVLIGYFINKMQRKANPRTKEEFFDAYFDDVERQKNKRK